MITNNKSGRRLKLLLAALVGILLAGFGTLHAQDELGQETYQQICSACHMADGAGVQLAFPPLAAHAAELAALEGGSNYMIRTVLFGLQGQIEIDGTAYNSIMTPWATALSDEQIAAVINFIVTQWPSEEVTTEFEAVTADTVAELRPEALTADQVLELRTELLSE